MMLGAKRPLIGKNFRSSTRQRMTLGMSNACRGVSGTMVNNYSSWRSAGSLDRRRGGVSSKGVGKKERDSGTHARRVASSGDLRPPHPGISGYYRDTPLA